MLNKLERKFGHVGLPNMTLVMLACMVIGYAGELIFDSTWYTLFCLYPPLIFQGQIWRLVTWMILPPSSLNLLSFILLLMVYQFGQILERTLGTFRYNFFIISGLLLTIIGALVGWGIGQLMGIPWVYASYDLYYLAMSTYLMVALLFPEQVVMLYMIIPLKLKWAALIHVAFCLYACVSAIRVYNFSVVVSVLVSFLNVAWMMWNLRNNHVGFHQRAKNKVRQKAFYNQVQEGMQQRKASSYVTKHKCAICGRTERDGDDLEFRFCSKCNGNYEYCQDHLSAFQM